MDSDDAITVLVAELGADPGAEIASRRREPFVPKHVCHERGPEVGRPLRLNTISGEDRFVREVALPEGAVVTVRLLDTPLADASSVELGRDVIENADRLPVRFRLEYDHERVSDGNEYSLSAEVRRGDDLLYINDTVHTVLTRGAPRNRDVVVISTDPFDRCVEPLPGVIHSSFQREDLPREAVLHIRLIDVTDPEARLVLTETRKADLKGFPIEFELPSEGVKISRHQVRTGSRNRDRRRGALRIPKAERGRQWLPHCPNADLLLINDVFPFEEGGGQ